MEDFSTLVKAVEVSSPQSQQATSQLLKAGVAALPSLIEAIRKSPRNTAGKLGDVILAMRDPERIPLLINLLNEKKASLIFVALQALGESRDERAFQPLLNHLMDDHNLETDRRLAAAALGELGNLKAIEELLKVAEEAQRVKALRLSLSCVIALAKLGNHEKASIVISVVNSEKDPSAQPLAVEALQYLVAPGVFQALEASAKSSYAEIRLKAIDGLLYFGTREAVESLIPYVNHKDPETSRHAISRINDLTGEDFEEGVSIKSLKTWWLKQQAKFGAGVCYRLGKPIWLPNIISLLEEPNTQARIANELRIITGSSFESNTLLPAANQPETLVVAQEWWKSEGHRFEPGALYKYGHKQDLNNVF